MVDCARIDVDASKLDGELTISNVSMHCPGWAVVDVSDLWLGPDQRGENLVIPGRPGRLARRRRGDETTHQLPMVIDGRFDRDGARHANEREGLRQNLLFLRTNVTDPTNVGFGQRTATLTVPDGSDTLTALVQVKLEVGAKQRGLWRAILDLTIPEGLFA